MFDPLKPATFASGSPFEAYRRLARAETDVVLIEVFTGMSNVELIAEPQWLASTFIGGPKTLPIRFKPRPQLSMSRGQPSSK